jgi:hypothetical protein
MNPSWKRAISPLGALVVGLLVPTLAAGASTDILQRDADLHANSRYKAAIEQCATLPSDAKRACESKAKAAERDARAREDAEYRQSDSREDHRVNSAKAAHEADEARCDAMKGDAQRACLDRAKATLEERAALARQDSGQEKLDADYRMAITQCNAMTGPQKESCAAQARARFGK